MLSRRSRSTHATDQAAAGDGVRPTLLHAPSRKLTLAAGDGSDWLVNLSSSTRFPFYLALLVPADELHRPAATMPCATWPGPGRSAATAAVIWLVAGTATCCWH